MFVLLILAIRFFSHQSKQESKTIIIDDETMNSNSKMEKNSHSFTIHLNDQKPALLENTIFEGLEKITDRSQWYVTANCWQADNAQSKEGPPKYIIDGDYESRWHSRYNMNSGGEGAITPPFYFIVDLNETVQLGRFQYGPRRKGSANGCFPNYRLYTGSSIEDVKKKNSRKKIHNKWNIHLSRWKQ
ncbi:hypothetical protein TRFO_13977 [Tritrichomonas foetus]|uniref:F5/8 type C domain-containing protein n=1 Tax=Tritrichomonas foetus TaxID=1144522 RepID=A0A1J4KWG5_9EUKA|nr:hypothetical protein TRFO_13977 [Tritrichomonas foetus]|eukprot:OHT15625.1 hypothetical protein TRFO_13977 [Tritrichomonas foetus]